MLKNEKQYNSAKAKLQKWLKAQDQLQKGASAGQPEWVIAEQAFGIQEQINQLQADVKEYEDTLAGKKKLPDPSLVAQIPYLLVSWRIARHWTQKDLAERVCLHENQIQKYESENYAGASLQTISKIAEALTGDEQCADRGHASV
jgi:ribosome-binding protein aMBF1 (putative translation factor)